MSHRLHPATVDLAPAHGARRKRAIWLALATLVAVAVAVVLLLIESGFEWRSIPNLLEEVNRPLAVLAMTFLPIIGFPISAVYLAAGALFGPWIGGSIVAGATLVHVTVTHLLARTVLRGFIARGQKKWQERLPGVPATESATLVAMIVIMPGLPYFVRNGLLVFSGVPLRYLFGVAVPLYVARSYVTIFVGNLGHDPSPRAVAILGAVFTVKLAIGGLLFLRLKHRARPAPPH